MLFVCITANECGLNQKNLQKVPDPLLKNEVCSELFLHRKNSVSNAVLF